MLESIERCALDTEWVGSSHTLTPPGAYRWPADAEEVGHGPGAAKMALEKKVAATPEGVRRVSR